MGREGSRREQLAAPIAEGEASGLHPGEGNAADGGAGEAVAGGSAIKRAEEGLARFRWNADLLSPEREVAVEELSDAGREDGRDGAAASFALVEQHIGLEVEVLDVGAHDGDASDAGGIKEGEECAVAQVFEGGLGDGAEESDHLVMGQRSEGAIPVLVHMADGAANGGIAIVGLCPRVERAHGAQVGIGGGRLVSLEQLGNPVPDRLGGGAIGARLLLEVGQPVADVALIDLRGHGHELPASALVVEPDDPGRRQVAVVDREGRSQGFRTLHQVGR